MSARAARNGRRRGTLLAFVLVLQAACAAFFVADALGDLGWAARWAARWAAIIAHTAVEGLVAAALVACVVFGALELRRTIERVERAESALRAAPVAFGELTEAHFDAWALSPAERDMALLAI